MSNKVYDILKWVCMIAIPAIGTLYAALSAIWGWGYSEQIVGTISAVNTALGVILGISNKQYTSAQKGGRTWK